MPEHAGGDSPRVIHAGLPEPAQGEPFLPGPTFAGPYHLAGDKDAHRYGYQRYGNPTWTRYEAALSELETGRAVVFPSGMTAVSSVLLELLEPGDVLVAPSTGPAFNLVLPRLGAIVTDRGGLLSHAAIVAREFGVPAVVGCSEATRAVPDGARVRVEGATGTVTVL